MLAKHHFRPENNFLLQALEPNIKPLSEYSRGELTKEVFKWIAIGSITASMIVAPGSGMILTAFNGSSSSERRRIENSLRGLRRNGFVSVDPDQIYTLTNKGKQKASQIVVDDLGFSCEEAWDGFWRVIMFDIPNEKKQHRDLFSWKIKHAGSRLLQKSIYVYPYPCKESVDMISEHYYVSKYVDFLVASSIPNEDMFIREFKLTKGRAYKSQPRL